MTRQRPPEASAYVITPSSAESLRRKSGSASSDRSSRTARDTARRRAATVIWASWSADLWAARRLAPGSPHADDLPGDGARGVGAQPEHHVGHRLARDVGRIRAHLGEVGRRADRGGSERIGTHTVVSLFLREGLYEREYRALGRRVRGDSRHARSRQGRLRTEEDHRALPGADERQEGARGQIRRREIDRELAGPRSGIAVGHRTTRREPAGEMHERVDAATRGITHASGERVDSGRVTQIGREGGGAQSSRVERVAPRAGLVPRAIDQIDPSAALGEGARHGLADLTFASDSRQDHASPRELHTTLPVRCAAARVANYRTRLLA